MFWSVVGKWGWESNSTCLEFLAVLTIMKLRIFRLSASFISTQYARRSRKQYYLLPRMHARCSTPTPDRQELREASLRFHVRLDRPQSRMSEKLHLTVSWQRPAVTLSHRCDRGVGGIGEGIIRFRRKISDNLKVGLKADGSSHHEIEILAYCM
jgi:hypothetical protein